MTVRELLDSLKDADPDLIVCAQQEAGACIVRSAKAIDWDGDKVVWLGVTEDILHGDIEREYAKNSNH